VEGRFGHLMAQLARRFNPQAEVLCVDTWLGSHRVLWSTPEYRRQLDLKNGYPQQYYQFLANVVLSNMRDVIFPMPMTSYAATDILLASTLRFELIYIDAHHDEDEVYGDVKRCWKLLRPGGTMFGDDYLVTEPGVVKRSTASPPRAATTFTRKRRSGRSRNRPARPSPSGPSSSRARDTPASRRCGP
jgi:hypothetical protein